jgi:hypothetical protein
MDIPGFDHAKTARESLGSASQIPASHDETNPAADRTIAEAQVHASLAIWQALADIAQELHIIRRQQGD